MSYEARITNGLIAMGCPVDAFEAGRAMADRPMGLATSSAHAVGGAAVSVVYFDYSAGAVRSLAVGPLIEVLPGALVARDPRGSLYWFSRSGEISTGVGIGLSPFGEIFAFVKARGIK